MAFLETAAIESLVEALPNFFSFCDLIPLQETSVENRTIHAVKLSAGEATDRPGVLLIAGVHARELVNPDMVLTLAFNLSLAYRDNRGLSFGGFSIPADELRQIMEGLDIFLLPLVNPDGRSFALASPSPFNRLWRRNRSQNPATPDPSCQGVDLNRNFDFLWSTGIGSSADPCNRSQIYKGPQAFSEPETRNIRSLLLDFPQIRCFVDVHSYSELILYPWGDDDNQSIDPSMNFQNPAFDGLRGVSQDADYREFIPETDLSEFIATAIVARDAIEAVRGRRYIVQQGVGLYPTTGTSSDYAYSLLFTDMGRRILGFTFETGREFQPPDDETQAIIAEGQAGLIALCGHFLAMETGDVPSPEGGDVEPPVS